MLTYVLITNNFPCKASFQWFEKYEFPLSLIVHATINYLLQSWFMYIHNLFEFWFISFHVNFLKAYLNWFSNWSSKFKFVYYKYVLLNFQTSKYRYNGKHIYTSDAETSIKGVSMDSMRIKVCIWQLGSITSHNICISKFFHFMNEPKS